MCKFISEKARVRTEKSKSVVKLKAIIGLEREVDSRRVGSRETPS